MKFAEPLLAGAHVMNIVAQGTPGLHNKIPA